MNKSTAEYATLDDWIAREAIPFSLDSPESRNAGFDKVVASLADSVELLGIGEALHGGEEILVLRNKLFERLVEAHGYSAVSLETSFPRARLIDDYVSGLGPASYEALQDRGFSHGFGRLVANRELVEWMRRYNADPSHHVKLRFYGFDSPTEQTGADSPRQVLSFVLDYLSSIDPSSGRAHRERIESLLGQDSDWKNPYALIDPAKSVGLSPAAASLRIETEDLLTDLNIRRPELISKSDESRYSEALHYTSAARQLLDYHAELARKSSDRVARILGIRDLMMADNLVYAVSHERGRGKVLAFAHNAHLQRGMAKMQIGPETYAWWPAGSQLDRMLGARYAVIGSGLGVSEGNGIDKPEAGTLEARLTALPGPGLFIPTHRGQGLPAAEIAALPIRGATPTMAPTKTRNPTYSALTHQSFADFDCLVVFDSMTYSRGGPYEQK